jgi:hypothetical protein
MRAKKPKKRSGGPADASSARGAARPEPATKKKPPPDRSDAVQPTAGEGRESPRGSTIPPFPKQRIDD